MQSKPAQSPPVLWENETESSINKAFPCPLRTRTVFAVKSTKLKVNKPTQNRHSLVFIFPLNEKVPEGVLKLNSAHKKLNEFERKLFSEYCENYGWKWKTRARNFKENRH